MTKRGRKRNRRELAKGEGENDDETMRDTSGLPLVVKEKTPEKLSRERKERRHQPTQLFPRTRRDHNAKFEHGPRPRLDRQNGSIGGV